MPVSASRPLVAVGARWRGRAEVDMELVRVNLGWLWHGLA